MRPTTPETTAAIADDATLLQLSAEPAHQLFPILNQASRMKALVVLFSMAPGIYALGHYTITENDALWGLKCLQMTTEVAAADAGFPKTQDHWSWEPPLARWLTALTVKRLNHRWPYGLLLTSYLAVAGTVGVAYLLGRTLFDDRFGVLLVLLLACHGPALRMALTPPANSLSILCVLLTFFGCLRHMQRSTQPISVDLLIGALGLALCLLAGPITLPVFATLFLTLTWPRRDTTSFSIRQAFKLGKRRAGCPSLVDVLLLGVIAIALAGWWPLRMRFQHGTEFWTAWLSGQYVVDPTVSIEASSSSLIETVVHILNETMQKLGFLCGLAALGFWFAIRELLNEFRLSKRLHPTRLSDTPASDHVSGTQGNGSIQSRRQLSIQFLTTWTICGLAAAMISRTSGLATSHIAELYSLFLMLPMISLATLAICGILERRANVFEVVGVTLLSTFAVIWKKATTPTADPVTSAAITTSLAVLVSIAVLAWCCQSSSRSREFAQQRILKTCIVWLVSASILFGLNSIRVADGAAADFRLLRHRLARIHNVHACSIISEFAPPYRLVFTLKSLWPTATLRIVGRWEDLVPAMIHTDEASQPRVTVKTASPKQSQRILVVWGSHSAPLPTALGERLPLTPVAFYLDERLLSVYRLIEENTE